MKRRLTLVCVLVLAAFGSLVLGGSRSVIASPTIIVNSVADPGDGVCDDRECTLREAIAAAPAGGRIEFALPGGSKIDLSVGELVIDKDLAIAGSTIYPGISVDAGRKSRVFAIRAGRRVEIVGLRIAQGETEEQQGGGVWNDGFLTLDHVRIEYNRVDIPVEVEGGGISNQGTLILQHSIVRKNGAPLGGGIDNEGEMFIYDSQIVNNGARIGGGGIFSRGTLTMLESEIAHNGSSQGAGIFNLGSLALRRTAVFSNTADFDYHGQFGGLFNRGSAVLVDSAVVANYAVDFGAGIASGGDLTLINSTVSGNRVGRPRAASAGGAGVSIYGLPDAGAPSLAIYYTTLTDNSPGGLYVNADVKSVQVGHSIIAGNRGDALDCTGVNLSNQWHSGGHNLVGEDSGCPYRATLGDQTVDSTAVFTTVLAPLPAVDENSNWATLVHALFPTGPAVDGGDGHCEDAQYCGLYADQRGAPRPVDGDGDGLALCDPGAYEYDPAPTPTPTPTPTPMPSPYTLLSTTVDGDTANGQWTLKELSDDGRLVLFSAKLDCSDPSQPAEFPQLFVLDRSRNHVDCISPDAPGEMNDIWNDFPSLSGDGNLIAFKSLLDVKNQVYVYNMLTSKASLVPFSPGDLSFDVRPTISDDGRYVIIKVLSSLIAAEHRCQAEEGIYVYDLAEERVLCAAGVDPFGPSGAVLYHSARVLLSHDNHIAAYVDGEGMVLHDLVSGQKWRAFHESYDNYRLYAVLLQDISADGRYTVFTSIHDSLIGNDNIMKTYVYDRSTNETRVLTNLDGFYLKWLDGPYPFLASISDDGRFIAFYSEVANLVPGDTNGEGDIFIYDQATRRTEAMPAPPGWMVPDGASTVPLLTADARTVVFQSLAHNLASFDRNDEWDIYSYQRTLPPLMLWLPVVQR